MLGILKSKTTWIIVGLIALALVISAGVHHYSQIVSENQQLRKSVQVSKVITDNLTDQQRAQAGTVDRQAQITIRVQKEGEKIKEEIRNEQPKKDQTVSPRVSAALRGVERLRTQQ